MRAAPPRDLPRFVPPLLLFVDSAILHYLDPANAVPLLAHIVPARATWLHIVNGAIVSAVRRRPWLG